MIRELNPTSKPEIDLVAARMRETLIEVLGEEKGSGLYSLNWLSDRVLFHLDPKRSDGKVFLKIHEKQIIGHAIARVETDETTQKPYGYFSTIYIAPSYRKYGFAKELMQQVESWFQERNLDLIRYSTDKNHKRLISIFNKAGYQITLRESDMVQLTKDLTKTSTSPLKLKSKNEGADGTIKILWELQDGHTIESVILPRALKQRKRLALWDKPQAGAQDRFTACVSSQVGCAMACDFCQTGKQGITRNLTADEIIAQVDELNAIRPITNIVFMGMGEPLQNLNNVTQAIEHLKSANGLKLSRRKITVSTSGVVHGLPELAKTGVRLAISLNATTDELRTKLMPINVKYPIAELIAAAKEYGAKTRQTVMLEYVLLKNLNDTPEDAQRLKMLAQGWDCKVNLIPYNSFEGVVYQRPEPEQVKQFQHALVSQGITATVRYSGGDDIAAACGQLKSLNALSKSARTDHRAVPRKVKPNGNAPETST